LSAQSAIASFTRVVTVAAGVFAPGHLGELTPLVPFELVDDVLEQTGTVQRRLRDLPSRVGVYLLLAAGMFPGLGLPRVWGELTAGLRGLTGLAVARPSEKALRDLRRRLGPAPLKALFEVLAGPLAWPYAPGVEFCGLRTVAFDGCGSLRAPDTDRTRAWLSQARSQHGPAGYPLPKLMALAETGTRGLLGAVIGAAADGDEPALARGLLHLLGPGMLVLADRAYDAAAFLEALAATGAQFLIRGKASRNPPVLTVLPDGSYRSRIGSLDVRVIDARVAITGDGGSRTGDSCRLITTLADHRRFPAARLTRLYHERWEIESAYYALRHTLLNGRVLRSRDRPGLEQELWALLTLYQLLRMAMTDAARLAAADPDRASFTTALHTAITQLTSAAGIIPADPAAPGAITTAITATLLPPRRPRYSARTLKCTRTRYPARPGDTRPARPENITAVDITIHAPAPSRPGPARPRRPAPPSPLRRHVTRLLTTTPDHPWTGHDLASHLGIPRRDLLLALARWTRAGHLTRTTRGTYTLPLPPLP
jgi:Insertion element 4 transposase N-terminal/Transposase DDE domain